MSPKASDLAVPASAPVVVVMGNPNSEKETEDKLDLRPSGDTAMATVKRRPLLTVVLIVLALLAAWLFGRKFLGLGAGSKKGDGGAGDDGGGSEGSAVIYIRANARSLQVYRPYSGRMVLWADAEQLEEGIAPSEEDRGVALAEFIQQLRGVQKGTTFVINTTELPAQYFDELAGALKETFNTNQDLGIEIGEIRE